MRFACSRQLHGVGDRLKYFTDSLATASRSRVERLDLITQQLIKTVTMPRANRPAAIKAIMRKLVERELSDVNTPATNKAMAATRHTKKMIVQTILAFLNDIARLIFPIEFLYSSG